MASGCYDITNKTLGKGHYGVVKLGKHCLTGELVALKIIEKSRLNKDSLNQLGTEIRILFRLSEYEHPNILKLYQTIDTEDKLFLVTEFCGPRACDLHDYISRKQTRSGLSVEEAQVFFMQICSAISYCHSMGIVHRDLKPENILVTDYKYRLSQSSIEGNPSHDLNYPILKLIDFGFANQWNPDEYMRTSCGTLAYSAPELLLGEPYDGTKVDVWGLGLMLYILLYGGNPFMQINDNETLTRILDCSFTTPKRDNVDQNAIDLLRSLIKRNPVSRLPIDAIMTHKWFSSLPISYELMQVYQIKPDNGYVKHNAKIPPVLSPTLPSISEKKPLGNINDTVDDAKLQRSASLKDAYEADSPSCTRTRSLSITRTPISQSQSLHQTKSTVNLERLHREGTVSSSTVLSLTPRSPSIYRPTSPDIGGLIAMTDEEREIHERVIQEISRLTKLIDSVSSIEASLKNARFAHRLFNKNSIQPVQFGKRKISTGLISRLAHSKNNTFRNQNSNEELGDGDALSTHGGPPVDRLGMINNKLNDDDYIYATYQLTRDKIIRLDQNFGFAPFSERCNETSNSSTRYFGHKTDAADSSMAYALPLARKCSLVCEESACSNDMSESGS